MRGLCKAVDSIAEECRAGYAAELKAIQGSKLEGLRYVGTPVATVGAEGQSLVTTGAKVVLDSCVPFDREGSSGAAAGD